MVKSLFSHLTSHFPAAIVARMNVVKATRQFETWLAQRTRIDQKDLRLKHTNMKKDVFMFFRATYYRWAQLWPKSVPTYPRPQKSSPSAIST